MITNKLKVGDYIFSVRGDLARITKVNKQTYSYVNLINNGRGNVGFNGIKESKYFYECSEWFECNDAQAYAFELAINHYKTYSEAEQIQQETKNLIANAKWYLEQIKDIDAEYHHAEEEGYDYYEED